MRDETPEPLWQVVVGDKEPWRKGRPFLIGFALLSALCDLLVCVQFILSGLIVAVLIYGAARLLFWGQFYFVWIGVHCIRWLLGGLQIFYGFCTFVWSFEQGSGGLMLAGIFFIGTGLFLGFAPPVYWFAIRQKENRSWPEAAIVGAVLLVLLAGLATGVFGFFRYQQSWREDARLFADGAFAHVFLQHDAAFLIQHATARILGGPYGRDGLERFVDDEAIRGGDVSDLRPAQGAMLLRYAFPFSCVATGAMIAEARGPHGRILLQMKLVGAPGDWQIDGILWEYPDRQR